MQNLFLASMITAFAATATFILALRPAAKSLGLLDRPGGRKSHIGNVPIVGGIAMFAGVFGGLVVVGDSGLHLPSLFVASFFLVVIGAMDDRYHLPPTIRVVAQIVSVLIMVFGANHSLRTIGDPLALGNIFLGPFALVATMVVSLTVINAYNLIDGVDGLAGSLALIALLSIAVTGGLYASSTPIALVIVASVASFLLFNYPVIWNRSVRTFMGDAGSTFLGFVIVWTALNVSQGETAVISPVYVLWFASIPVYDLLTCFVRRTIAGKSPFTPGRDHFHHTLKRGGLSVREVLGLMTALQIAYACFGIAAHAIDLYEPVVFLAWAVMGLMQRQAFKLLARHNRLRLLRRRLAAARKIA